MSYIRCYMWGVIKKYGEYLIFFTPLLYHQSITDYKYTS